MNHFSPQKQTIVAPDWDEGRAFDAAAISRTAELGTLQLRSQAVAEVSVDGGKVRLRNLKDSESPWRDYKAVRKGCIYYGGFFQDNLALIDYVNSQHLAAPLVCLGDGHDGVWNIFREIATTQERLRNPRVGITD